VNVNDRRRISGMRCGLGLESENSI